MAERRAKANQPPPLQARDKLAFLLALVPWLIDHDRVTVQQAAGHFGVSAQQIRDAVELIAVSGVPGETAAYQHEDLFDISWDDFEERDEIVITNRVALDDAPRFSAREAAALIAGLQYLSSLPENADRTVIASLMGKLSRGASAAPAPVAVEGSRETESALALARDSVARGVQLEFDYQGAHGQAQRRRVDPLRVESVDADWYLRGWCHLREAVRTFRLDRMSNPRVTDAPIQHRAGEVRLPDALFEPSTLDLEVTIDVEPAAMPLLADYLPDGASTTPGGRIRTTVRVSHHHGLKRLMARLSGVAVVVAPEDARRAVAEWAAAGVRRYSASS